MGWGQRRQNSTTTIKDNRNFRSSVNPVPDPKRKTPRNEVGEVISGCVHQHGGLELRLLHTSVSLPAYTTWRKEFVALWRQIAAANARIWMSYSERSVLVTAIERHGRFLLACTKRKLRRWRGPRRPAKAVLWLVKPETSRSHYRVS